MTEKQEPSLRMDDGKTVLHIPTGPFTHTILRDSRIGPENTDIRCLQSWPFSDGEIESYHRNTKLWNRYGQRVVKVARDLGRYRIYGGLVGRLCDRFGVPLHRPADRTTMISGIIAGAGATVHLENLELGAEGLHMGGAS